MADTNKPSPDQQLGLERLVFFSDAVMAIAITLLALNLHVPELDPAQAAAQLPGQLAALGPSLMTFFISFLVIGIYWISHHRYFGYIRRYDTRLILLNLLFLFFIICMPFLASLLGQYVFIPIALMAYSLAIAALGFSLALIWVYASHDRRLISADVEAEEIRSIRVRLFAAPVVFLVAVPFAYVSTAAVIVIWWLSPLIVRLALNLWGGRTPKGQPGRTPPGA
ncbi:MAG TPA: TMEM175 family protein [Anaerolineales bacterium]|nr:TMEM175 family protein [Anaerolineales bacterium]